jgi:isopropylmalate/homocitrate/citramalate synthase
MAKAGKADPPDMDMAGILGRKRQIVVGKMSGSSSIKMKMGQLGIPIPENNKIMEILNRVKAKAIEKHHALTDEEFKSVINQIICP